MLAIEKNNKKKFFFFLKEQKKIYIYNFKKYENIIYKYKVIQISNR